MSHSKGRRQTRWTVHLIDRVADWTITVGGIFVIVAVLGMMVYLVGVVVPLFLGAHAKDPTTVSLPGGATPLVLAEIDEYRSMILGLREDGSLQLVDADQSKPIELGMARLALPARLTALARPLQGGGLCLGLEDGSVVVGKIAFDPDFPAESEVAVPPNLAPGKRIVAAGGVVERTPEGRVRRIRPRITLDAPLIIAQGDPIVAMDCRISEAQESLTVLTQGGRLLVGDVSSQKNFLTGQLQRKTRSREIPWAGEKKPDFVLLTTRADQLYVAWADGTMWRYDMSAAEGPVVAEKVDLTPEPGAELRTLGFPIGEQSLVAGDSLGRVRGYVRVPRADDPPNRLSDGGTDGFVMARAHDLEAHGAGVVRAAFSLRDKSFVTIAENGEVWLRHLTSEQTLLKLNLPLESTPTALQIAPKADGILAIQANGAGRLWAISNPHPEITIGTLAGKVWYEGYSTPGYTWQSSSGTDEFEPKFSLVPVAFGTLKATLFAMLFAVPLALFGALYTSEFMHRDLRNTIKPVVEIMASLPSVVLGFIAALLLAPLVEQWALAVLLGFALCPLLFLLAGLLVQLLPHPWPRRLGGGVQVALMLMIPILSFAIAGQLAPLVEYLAFAGSFKGWLSGQVGSGATLTSLLVLPFCLVALGLFYGSRRPQLLSRFEASSNAAPVVELFGMLAVLVASVGIALLIGWLGATAGVDLRPYLVGTYVQRNTLIVSFAMGFAVIPLIYTIAEDALGAVPDDLRSASLGCGATRWQTAIRVVLPMATSGIFAAVMIGLGRAVGETMIVLMAAGNTPLIDLNPFNGLRALSANIAVELPEAVQNSTLYRVLFLAALVLFVSTFVINTLAELVRHRFRKRVMQL